MIGLDKILFCLKEKCSKCRGKSKQKDPEDPAALVGSFKRYKN
jgi:hypothetical protein